MKANENSISGPVDALAVMDCAANTMRDMKCANRDLADVQAKALRQARAAVAELVARFETVLEWCETIQDDDSRVPRQDMNAAYAALAKFGGR